MSGLTKKTVYTDKLLAAIMGVAEGDHVSYADLTRGLHKYIKDHNLKSPQPAAAPTPSVPSAPSGPRDEGTTAATVLPRTCRNCEAEIPPEAVFCDLCGARQ